jgi:16S rRNA (uracil1498-N3)-methyltransferase
MAHRFYLPPDQCRGRTLRLAGSEGHHALHVLRVRSGDRVTILDGAGQEFLCEVAGIEDNQVGLNILETHSHPPPSCEVTLLQALPKGKLIESIIQKATELGAARVVPLLSERVVVHLDAGEGSRKAEKWQAVAVEGIKQCGAAWLPRVEFPVTPKQFLARGEKFELSVIGSLQPDARHPRLYLDAFRSEHRRNPTSLAVWVGPEGDFTPAEVQTAQAAGAKPITLGPLVLRADTAAFYCLSALNYELQAPLS